MKHDTVESRAVSFLKSPFVLVLALVLLLGSSGPVADRLAGLTDSNDRARRKATGELRKERTKLIEGLMNIVKQNASNDASGPRACAISVLGHYRATEAVDLLAEGLTFVPSLKGTLQTGKQQAEEYSVCAVALVRIGLPAVGKMEEIALNSADPEARSLAAWVIMTVEGRDRGILRFEEALDRQDDRAEDALSYIRNWQARYGDPTGGAGRPGGWDRKSRND